MEQKENILKGKNEIEHNILNGFNRSSKVLEHKLGINAARVLNMLIYKHNYWLNREGLIDIDGKQAFYITIPNIQVETNLSKEPIYNAIKKLKEEKLVEVYKIGLPARNHYIVNIKEVNELENNHAEVYLKWRESVYSEATTSRKRFDERPIKETQALCLQQLDVKQTTSELENSSLVNGFSSVTKNKITKNKISKNFTNRINAVELRMDLMEYSDELEKLIDDFRGTNDEKERELCNKKIFDFLCKIIPPFNGFIISEQDYKMIDLISGYYSDSNYIASKILSNAEAILDCRKTRRFGNLFVALDLIDSHCKLRYG